jgi:formamidopyrimidine-DNA glycosylase
VPELPEVEAVRRMLRPAMEGARFEQVVIRRPDLRAPFPRRFAARLAGQTVRALQRRGKYLLVELSSGDTLVLHLGMSGSFRVAFAGGNAENLAHDHVVFRMSSGATVTFNDPRRFGSMQLLGPADRSGHRTLGALGPEPLSREFGAAVLAARCRGKKTSLKAALSDQRVVAGLGNIYVCEALHRAGLSPRRRAGSIATRTGAPGEAADRLAAAIKKVIAGAVARVTVAQGGGEISYGPDRFRVYDREGRRCLRPRCPGVVRRIVQGGRSTFFCPVCQR